MYRDVEYWCKFCIDCVMRKDLKYKVKVFLLVLLVEGVFDCVVVDCLGFFLVFYVGNRYIIVFIYYLIWCLEVFVVKIIEVYVVVCFFMY